MFAVIGEIVPHELSNEAGHLRRTVEPEFCLVDAGQQIAQHRLANIAELHSVLQPAASHVPPHLAQHERLQVEKELVDRPVVLRRKVGE